MRFHMHRYKFDSESVNGHNHVLLGYTNGTIGVGMIHFHYFSGVSSYRNHTHYYAGLTGISIKTENGHIHKMEGILEHNNSHEHCFKNYTFEDIEYIGFPRYSKWAIGNK